MFSGFKKLNYSEKNFDFCTRFSWNTMIIRNFMKF